VRLRALGELNFPLAEIQFPLGLLTFPLGEKESESDTKFWSVPDAFKIIYFLGRAKKQSKFCQIKKRSNAKNIKNVFIVVKVEIKFPQKR
tara:strand:- start:131 stop:400 length:270 start_codon:yes stop_codon:yes gene_type:complete